MNNINEKFCLDHLNPTEFENFCYDLLAEIGCTNLNWRKGTGLSNSPADSGRDLECTNIKSDVDGTTYAEKWFVECKQSKKGISASQLNNLFTWAEAERPNIVLIITSNFLSNPAKEWINKYKDNHQTFRIKYWELPDLERLSSGRIQLLRKYKISSQFPYLSIIHPTHIEYLKFILPNTLNYLFKVLNDIDPDKREKILQVVYHEIINPRYKTLESSYDRIEDLRIDELDYNAFKLKCKELAKVSSDSFVVASVVNAILQNLLTMGDITASDILIERYLQMIFVLNEGVRQEKIDSKEIQSFVNNIRQQIEDLPSSLKEYHNLYKFFCENVVNELFLEEMKFIGPLQNIINFV